MPRIVNRSDSQTVDPGLLQQRYASHPAAPGHPDRRRLAAALASARGAPLDWMNVAFEAFSDYRFAEGHAALDTTIRLAPDFLPARWLRFQYPPEVSPADHAQLVEFRQRWADGLAAFERLDFNAARWRSQVWGCVGACTAFYRHYLDDCTDQQRRYGELVHRMMAALDPGDPPRPVTSGRRRVLFCSPYFYAHTVARLFVPLIESLDRDAFDVHCLHFGPDDDAMTARARRIGSFHADPLDAPGWRRLIGRLAPDVIVYLDLGMHPLPQALAALRLAPVQACLWGHPVSTGLPTIDYVLSPDAMEPADGEHHYTERLVRLPGLGHGLDPLPAGASADVGRDDSIELICAQSIYKLMPDQDALFARILGALPGARLHLIPHQQPHVREWLRERMRPRLAEHGVDADRRIVMHGYRPLPEFLELAGNCVLNLDSIGWSGGMSSLDLLRLGLPTVTLPGGSMRSRQTAAILHRLGVSELVVGSHDEYVELAIALARDPARRRNLSARLSAGLPKLHERETVAAALAGFLSTCEPPRRA